MRAEAIFGPVSVLALWTLAVLSLTGWRRVGGTLKGHIPHGAFRVGESADVPSEVSLLNRNLMNLLEMPVLFYVVCLALYVTRQVQPALVLCAWLYVFTRAGALVHPRHIQSDHPPVDLLHDQQPGAAGDLDLVPDPGAVANRSCRRDAAIASVQMKRHFECRNGSTAREACYHLAAPCAPPRPPGRRSCPGSSVRRHHLRHLEQVGDEPGHDHQHTLSDLALGPNVEMVSQKAVTYPGHRLQSPPRQHPQQRHRADLRRRPRHAPTPPGAGRAAGQERQGHLLHQHQQLRRAGGQRHHPQEHHQAHRERGPPAGQPHRQPPAPGRAQHHPDQEPRSPACRPPSTAATCWGPASPS